MKRLAVLVVLCGIAMAVAQERPRPLPKPGQPHEEPQLVAEMLKKQKTWHRRSIGALLTIEARSGKPDPKIDLVIDWTIDYNGPRHPFIILSPTFDLPLNSQTIAHFWYPDADGKANPFKVYSYAIQGASLDIKEMYSVSQDKKPVTGRTGIAYGSLTKAAKREFASGDKLYFQLEHSPQRRGVDAGGDWMLDAWTGHLWSQVVEVKFE